MYEFVLRGVYVWVSEMLLQFSASACVLALSYTYKQRMFSISLLYYIKIIAFDLQIFGICFKIRL